MGREVVECLREYVDKLRRLGFPVASAVLFGSRARGDHLRHSDVDLLVILRRSSDPFLNRVAELARHWDEGYHLEVFPYTTDEVKALMNRGSVAIYDALDHGVVIVDDGTFEELRERFREARSKGIVGRGARGWWRVPSRALVE
ncbi:MAG: nucleotidyltransferase domain-containing protein [Thermoprotei archaeon]|nr:MAG: nucleotidyltransferase domain-containing protein [Thermoprotei archaeon]